MTAKKTTVTTEQELVDPELRYELLVEQRNEAQKKRSIQIQADLNERFPEEVERELKKGGAYLTYIPVSEVISRLNKVFGYDGWSYEIIKCERDALDPDFIIAHVRLSVYSGSDRFAVSVKDGFGGLKIKRTKTGDIVDLGDEFKGAVSDALKKAAQALGVGLYLARTEEAMEIEAEASIDPVVDELWNQFLLLAKGLDADKKHELNEAWQQHSGNRPKPTKQTANAPDLEFLISKCLQMAMDPGVS